MRAVVWATLLAVGLAMPALGQEVNTPNDWKKMYLDASEQLRAAQDRKAELAAVNTKLTAKLSQIQSDLAAARSETAALRRQAADEAADSYMTHTFYAGWEAFIQSNSLVCWQWRAFWGQNTPLWSNNEVLVRNPNWPFP